MKILSTLTVSGNTTLAAASATSLTLGTDLAIAEGGTGQSTGYAALDALSIHGADIASAGTINLETATGNVVDVTGGTTITVITLSDGHERTVRFTGGLTLTHGASLVLPGGVNIITIAGDVAVFRGYAASVVRCTSYSPITVTGTGAAVKATSPALITPTIDGNAVLATTITSAAQGDILARTGAGFVNVNIGTNQVVGRITGEVVGRATTGTGNVVQASGPTLVAPILGAASATSLATSAATPLLLTNGQLVNIALTSQTVGATTLTIPDFASVVDEFVFKTKSVTMSNKTFVAPVLGVASATSLATSAATPLLLTNGQLVNIALTSQTTGATTLTIPDFASVVDEFTFKTKTQTMSNKTFVAPALGTPTSGVLTSCTGLPTTGLVDEAVTLAKMANLAQDAFIVRTTASTGVPETATCTAAARTVMDDATVGAMVDTLGGAAASGTGGLMRRDSAVVTTEITIPNTGLHILDTNASHDLIIAPGSNITADRTLTITTGDANRTITLNGDTTLTGTNTGDHAAIGALSTLQAGFTVMIDGGGSTITTGVKHYIEMPIAMTITGWTLVADVSGSIIIDIWKDTYANFPPVDADSITASDVPTLTTAQKAQDLAPTGWTTAVAQGDILGFNVDSATTVTKVWLTIRGTRVA